PSAVAVAISQSASTPPPCPPRAAMVSFSGRSLLTAAASEGVAQSPPLAAPLQEADERAAQRRQDAVTPGGIVNELRAVERRTEHGRVRHLATHPTADAGVIDMRDRVAPQRVGVGAHREGRTPREADARVIARAGVRIDAEALAHHALPGLDRAARL